MGVTRLPGEPWRPYTRVVVTVRVDRGFTTTDVSNWCPPCWTTEGRALQQQRFPAAEFTEMEVPTR